ncbi:MAG: AraC family transcriptional regulator [Clostridiales bacterium]|nr:AraC family transcriptional regulator [Clostridiales bacterium]
MRIFQRLTQANTHQKLVRLMIFWLLICYFFFLLIYSLLAFRVTENRLLTENSSLASQTRHSVDDIYQRVQAISNQILQDPLATAYLYERTSYPLAQANLNELLVDYQKSHPLLMRYIGLYNGYLGTYETSLGPCQPARWGCQSAIALFSLRPREIRVEGSALDALKNEFTRLIVFYARVENNPQRTNHGLVIIHVDEEKFVSLLADFQPRARIYLTDANGIVFASSEPDAFITDLSFGYPFSGIFQNESGTRQLSDQGILRTGNLWQRQLTYFLRSQTSGLFTVVVLDSGLIWLEYLKTIAPVLLVSLIFILTSSWIILKLLARFYQPLQSLVRDVAGNEVKAAEEYAVLHKALLLGDQAARIAREKFLADLLAGKPNHEDAERIQQILRQLEAPAYLLVVARFDGFSSLPNQSGRSRQFPLHRHQHYSGAAGKSGTCDGPRHGDHEVTLIVQLNDAVQPEGLEDALEQAQSQIRRYFPFTVSYAAAEPVTSFAQFNESYLKTCNLFSYRLYFGPDSLLTPEKTIAVNKKIRYPVMAEKRILEALNLRRQDMLVPGIDDFMQAIREGYSPRTVNYFNQLLFSVFKQVDNTVELVDEDYDNYLETSDRLSRCDQLEDARQIIARFCLELMSISQEKARRATDAKHERLHDELVNYLRENLSDPNLSLESTAERFNLSSGYLGKLVKASAGDTFSSLLSTMRLEKAAQLLIETSQPAYKVAEQVGIPNVAYFSTLFKRQYGSPLLLSAKNAAIWGKKGWILSPPA